jgi:hypothetical protein
VTVPEPVSSFPLPDTLWTRTYGGPDQEDGRQVIAFNAGYVIGGRTRSFGAGNVDVYVIRVALNGDTVWTRTFGGAYNDGAVALTETADSCVAVAYTSAFNTGNPDAHLVKLNAGGVVLWAKTYGGLTGEACWSVAATPDRGYILTGSAQGDAFLLKTGETGDTTWIRYFGGSASEAGYAVRTTPDNGYILAGATESYGAGASDAWLVKTDSVGSQTWAKTFGGISDDIAWQAEVNSDGGFSLVGETWSYGPGTPDYSNLFLVKTNGQGDTIWTRNYGGIMGDGGYSIRELPSHKTIVAGYTETGGFGAADLWLLKLNDRGDTLAASVYGGTADDKGAWVLPTPDLGYLVCGTTGSFGQGGNDIWLLKIAADTMAINDGREGKIFKLTVNPNPFRTTTYISKGHSAPLRGSVASYQDFQTEKSVALNIYDVAGSLVYSLTLGSMPHALCWAGTDQKGRPLPSGIYFLIARCGRFTETKKIVLVRGSN